MDNPEDGVYISMHNPNNAKCVAQALLAAEKRLQIAREALREISDSRLYGPNATARQDLKEIGTRLGQKVKRRGE